MDFNDKMMGLIHAMRRFHMFAHRGASPLQDVSRGQGRILAMLKIKPNLTTRDLSYLLGIRQQSLNESLKKLEREGYITRQPDPTDRRVMRIDLTDKGKEVKQIINETDDVLNEFSDEELEQFGSYVDRLKDAYGKRISAEAGPEDQQFFDEMEERMEAMRERMGDNDFDEMMHRCRHMGMPMGMPFGGMHHRRHGCGC